MSELKGVIDRVLCDVHIETGRKDDYEEVVSNLENAISKSVLSRQQEEIERLKILVSNAYCEGFSDCEHSDGLDFETMYGLSQTKVVLAKHNKGEL